ncbi:MAG: bifunctional hydroxymethylpyrimidine kinase/phosphomethylpyrimidine kinase [Bacteroidota bacterium]
MHAALTIAGSDSGGGAGIQADLKTFEALGVFGMSAITAVTAQNTQGVTGFVALEPSFVTQQIETVAADLPVNAVKTGMLATAEIVHAVADAVERLALAPLVVDPVMVATSGDPLLAPDAVQAYRERLLPLAEVLTPNTHEAEALLGWPVRTLDDARRAAREILTDLGGAAVLVKGGHLDGETEAVDVLADPDGERIYRTERIETTSTHGTGCTLASAIAAHLARGETLREAVAGAKAYLTEALRHAPGLGGGHGPVRHLWMLTER